MELNQLKDWLENVIERNLQYCTTGVKVFVGDKQLGGMRFEVDASGIQRIVLLPEEIK